MPATCICRIMLISDMKNEIIIYQGKSGSIEFKGDYKNETLWASLQQITDLFETDKSGISRHIGNIYKCGELKRKATVAKIATVTTSRQAFENLLQENDWIRDSDYTEVQAYELKSGKGEYFKIN